MLHKFMFSFLLVMRGGGGSCQLNYLSYVLFKSFFFCFIMKLRTVAQFIHFSVDAFEEKKAGCTLQLCFDMHSNIFLLLFRQITLLISLPE